MNATTKPTNPKDAVGSGKLPLNLVPDSARAYMALAFLEGALKYGTANWRIAGVRASIYRAALDRHIMKWWNGEWADPKTQVPHLANALACIAILLDAELVGKLTDDRPPQAAVSELIDGMDGIVSHLKEMFAAYNPRHYTIKDGHEQEIADILKKPLEYAYAPEFTRRKSP